MRKSELRKLIHEEIKKSLLKEDYFYRDEIKNEYDKILKVAQSCKTISQLQGANKMVDTWLKNWRGKMDKMGTLQIIRVERDLNTRIKVLQGYIKTKMKELS